MFLHLTIAGAFGAATSIEYEVELHDPLRPEAKTKSHTVFLIFDENGFPAQYHMSLYTAVCLHDTCKPIKATLYWDALGRYTHMEHPGNWPITKYDHRYFSAEDYATLDRILKNQNSLLGKHPLDFFVAAVKPDALDVDGTSRATPLAVKGAVVKDAAYTSWVLWHWVNGEITEKLLDITRRYATDAYLAQCVQSKDAPLMAFGLNELSSKDSLSEPLRDACLQALEYSDRRNSKLAIHVLTEKAENMQALQQDLVARFGVNTGASSVILRWLERQNDVAPGAWEALAAQLQQVNNYFDLFEALMLLENRASDIKGVRKHIEALTQSKDKGIRNVTREFLEQ